MSLGWVLVLAAIGIGACVDQLIRTQRFMAVLREVTAAGERLAGDPDQARVDLTVLLHRGDYLTAADRRAMWAWGIVGGVVLAAAVLTS